MTSRWSRLVRRRPMIDATEFWQARYERGGTSGPGSYGRLAEFKATFLNDLVTSESIGSAIELGCGDGHQLAAIDYPRYLGFDVSPRAVELCTERFEGRADRSFCWFDPEHFHDPAGFVRADLTVSLDVLYHLLEESALARHLELLFSLSDRLVVIYAGSPRRRDALVDAEHVRHQDFEAWIEEHRSDWELDRHVPNAYPFDPEDPDETSFSDFFVYRRRST